eukprot:3068816-Rhodomonas_salina.3
MIYHVLRTGVGDLGPIFQPTLAARPLQQRTSRVGSAEKRATLESDPDVKFVLSAYAPSIPRTCKHVGRFPGLTDGIDGDRFAGDVFDGSDPSRATRPFAVRCPALTLGARGQARDDASTVLRRDVAHPGEDACRDATALRSLFLGLSPAASARDISTLPQSMGLSVCQRRRGIASCGAPGSVSVCMCVCASACVHVSVCMCLCACVCVHVSVCMCLCLHVYLHVCVRGRVCVYPALDLLALRPSASSPAPRSAMPSTSTDRARGAVGGGRHVLPPPLPPHHPRGTPRNATQETAIRVQFVPGRRVPSRASSSSAVARPCPALTCAMLVQATAEVEKTRSMVPRLPDTHVTGSQTPRHPDTQAHRHSDTQRGTHTGARTHSLCAAPRNQIQENAFSV